MIPIAGIGVPTYVCHFQGGNQRIIQTKIGDIRFLSNEQFCITAKDWRTSGNNVKLKKCLGDMHIQRSPPPGLMTKL